MFLPCFIGVYASCWSFCRELCRSRLNTGRGFIQSELPSYQHFPVCECRTSRQYFLFVICLETPPLPSVEPEINLRSHVFRGHRKKTASSCAPRRGRIMRPPTTSCPCEPGTWTATPRIFSESSAPTSWERSFR